MPQPQEGAQIAMTAADDMVQWLHSNDIDTVSEVKTLILDLLNNKKNTWLLPYLLDFYMQSQSRPALDILFQVSASHEKQILDKLQEHLKGTCKLQALMLCGRFVRKQVPLTYNIVQHSIFMQILKTIKEATDVPILVSAVLLVTCLLPMVPIAVKNYLGDIFDGFSRLAAFSQVKPVNVPEAYILHLQVAVYCMFHRLYGMYPCHFLTYLRSVYSKDGQQQVFSTVIKPMLERVRMHPLLVTANKEKEVSMERWRHYDVHDIVVECAKYSLDLIEGASDEVQCPIVGRTESSSGAVQRKAQFSLASDDAQIQPNIMDTLQGTVELFAPKPLSMHGAGTQSIVQQALSSATFFSPSQMCGLSTPPPGEKAQTQTLSAAPFTVPDSPLLTDAESRDKKRLSSGLTISVAGLIPGPVIGGTGGGNSVPPSPMRPEFCQDTSPFQFGFGATSRYQAVRKIDFQVSPGINKETTLSPLGSVSNKQETGQGSPSVTSQVSPARTTMSDEALVRARADLLRQPTLDDPSPTVQLDKSRTVTHGGKTAVVEKQDSLTSGGVFKHPSGETTSSPLMKENMTSSEVTVTPENVDKCKSDTPVATKSAQSVSASSSEYALAPEKSQSQLSRDLENVMSSEAQRSQLSSPVIPSKTNSEDLLVQPTSSNTTTGLFADVDEGVVEASEAQSSSVPSVHELPHFIETLDHAADEADDEVSALTRSAMTDRSFSSSLEPPDVTLTAESVQLLMKKVNRIRFNSMNLSASRERQERRDISAPVAITRASSCPDFEDELARQRTESGGEPSSSCPTSEEGTVTVPSVRDVNTPRRTACGASTCRGFSVHINPVVATMSYVSAQTLSSTVTVTTETTATIGSQTSFIMNQPEEEEIPVQVLLEDEIDARFPYSHMFPIALHIAPFMQCYNCSQENKGEHANKESRPWPDGRLNTAALGLETPYFTTLSAPELLDRQMELARKAHSARQRGDKPHWPLAPGAPWTEDVETLRGQILMLHNQLLYERHKRELYARRNRRLLSRIVRTVALEEENQAMADHVKLQGTAITDLKARVSSMDDTIAKLKQAKIEVENQRAAAARANKGELEGLKRANEDSQKQVTKLKAEKDLLTKELHNVRAKLFDTDQELMQSQQRASMNTDLQAQMARLNKELLLMGELQMKYQQRLGQMAMHPSNSGLGQQDSFVTQSYKAQLASQKQEIGDLRINNDAIRARLAEVEGQLKIKEEAVTKLKTALEDVNRLHKCQTEALEAKYTTERRIQQSLQAEIMKLTGQLELAQASPHQLVANMVYVSPTVNDVGM